LEVQEAAGAELQALKEPKRKVAYRGVIPLSAPALVLHYHQHNYHSVDGLSMTELVY
jgi:hypothetical protein